MKILKDVSWGRNKKDFPLTFHCSDEQNNKFSYSLSDFINEYKNIDKNNDLLDPKKILNRGYFPTRLKSTWIHYLNTKTEEEISTFLDDLHLIPETGSSVVYVVYKGELIKETSNINFLKSLKDIVPEEILDKKIKSLNSVSCIEKNGEYFLNFSTLFTSVSFYRQMQELNKSIDYRYSNPETYKLKNKSELFFFMKNFEDISFDISSLSPTDISFFNEITKEKVEVNNSINYVDDVVNQIKRKDGKIVVADSTSKKIEAVSKFLVEDNKKSLIIGKPESLKEFQDFTNNDNIYVKNTELSNKKDLIKVKTSSNKVYEFKDNSIFSNDELLVSDVESFYLSPNNIISYKLKNEEEGEIGGNVVSILTKSTEKIINECKGIETFVLSDAEKIKDIKSIINLTLSWIINEINPKNKIFVSSNPIYNGIKEVGPILNILDNNLLSEISTVLDSITSRDSKFQKENFITSIIGKYILKRDKEKLVSLLGVESENTVKNTKIVNKRIGSLKEEEIFYNDLKSSLNSSIKKMITTTFRESSADDDYLNFYTKSFENFKIIKGEKLDNTRLLTISSILKENGIEEKGYDPYIFSEKFIKENIKNLNPEAKEKVLNYIEGRKQKTIDDLFSRRLKTPFSKIREFDIKNNEIIDGVSISTRQFEDSLSLIKESDIPSEFKVFLSSFVKKGGSCKKFLDYFKSYISQTSSFLRERIKYDISFLSSVSRLKSYGYEIPEENKEVFLNEEIKKLKNLQDKMSFIIEGEKVHFFKLLEKKINLKELHKKMRELKTKNTKRVVRELVNNLNENVMILSMYNTIGEELLKTFPDAILVKNKEDLENLNIKDKEGKIVISTFNKIGENVKNKFVGSLVYNDFPWNKRTREKVENSLSQKDVVIYINKMDDNVIDDLFSRKVERKNEEIKKIMDGVRSYEELSDKDLKEIMIKGVFKDVILNFSEQDFNQLRRVENIRTQTNNQTFQEILI